MSKAVVFKNICLPFITFYLPTGKRYRPDYMEDAIAKYLTLCQAPEFAVRYLLGWKIILVS